MKPILSLTEWAVHGSTMGPYAAPENAYVTLSGLCPARAAEVSRTGGETRRIYTSGIVKVETVYGFVVATTASGSRYRIVGPPCVEFAEWCHEVGVDPALRV